MGILGSEAAIVAFKLVNGQFPALDLIYLIVTNAIAMALFLGEGLLLHRKTKPENAARQERRASTINPKESASSLNEKTREV